jgi:hypothetical protein
VIAAVLALTVAAPLPAQARRATTAVPATTDADAVRRAVESITESDYRRIIDALADDSMRGRMTPSPELDKAAEFIVAAFRRFGLAPGAGNGSYIQRYPIRQLQLDTSVSSITFEGAAALTLRLGRDAIFTPRGGTPPAAPVTGPVVLVWGIPADTARPFGDVDVRGAVVVHVTATSSFFGANAQVADRGFRAGAAAWIAVPAAAPASFDAMARFGTRPQTVMETATGTRVFLAARDSALAPLLAAAGTDLAQLRAAGAAGARALGGTTATVSVRRTVLHEDFAPNVVGILEGSDSLLRGEYVVFSAHMDHVGVAGRPGGGCSAAGADSICNGADDNASGTTGIVELAEAFALLQPRPRRSTVFLLISGEERGLWGSEWYAAHPTVPMAGIVANVNMDMIGRNWRDTISVIGKEHSSLGATANRITQERPELGMRLVDDLWPGENFYSRSDHYNFARLGVPILFFFNGTHPQYHRPSDEPALIDAEKAARIVRMVFYLGLDVANTTERPQWNPESRQRIVEDGR